MFLKLKNLKSSKTLFDSKVFCFVFLVFELRNTKKKNQSNQIKGILFACACMCEGGGVVVVVI